MIRTYKWHFFSLLLRKKDFYGLVFCSFFNKITINLYNSILFINFLPRELYFLHFVVIKSTSFYYYDFFSDFTAIHYPTSFFELRLQCILRNLLKKQTVIFSIGLSRPFLMPSLSSLYKAVDWLEREMYDMFGVWFFNHLNLRRLLTDYGFKGFPLLKDFPVFGFKELRYDIEHQQLIYTPLVLTQKWRNYLFLRQWK